MKHVLSSFVIALALVVLAATGWAAKITGELVEIDGEYYIVVDQEGNEHEIHFDTSTKKDGEVEPGAQVEVDEDRGHAKSIKAVKMKKN